MARASTWEARRLMVRERIEIIIRDGFTCQECGKMLSPAELQLAHRIMQARQSKQTLKHIRSYIKKVFGDDLTLKQCEMILHDEDNLVTTCSLSCNSSFNIWNNPIETDKLITKIYMKNREYIINA